MFIMLEILTFMSLLLITSYTIAVCVKEKEIPYSISETFYDLKHRFWFSVSMASTAMTLLPTLIKLTPIEYIYIPYLACFGLIIVASAPRIKEQQELIIHTTGAMMCVVFSQIWVCFHFPWFLTLWSIYLLYSVIQTFRKWNGNIIQSFISTKPMFWVEITALTIVYLSLTITFISGE